VGVRIVETVLLHERRVAGCEVCGLEYWGGRVYFSNDEDAECI
jgi:hypothetical protein